MLQDFVAHWEWRQCARPRHRERWEPGIRASFRMHPASLAARHRSVGKHCAQEIQEINGRLATNHARATHVLNPRHNFDTTWLDVTKVPGQSHVREIDSDN